jgi:hypothetical protein
MADYAAAFSRRRQAIEVRDGQECQRRRSKERARARPRLAAAAAR